MSGDAAPDLSAFRALARTRRVIPVTRRLLVDEATAVGLFRALCGDRPGTFLLESAVQGRWSRWSFIGVRAAAMLTERDGRAAWLGRPPVGMPDAGRGVDVLRATAEALRTDPLPGMPPLTGGLVGYLAYDAVRAFERVPDDNPDELGIPELAFLLAVDLAVLDHSDGSVLLIANAVNYDGSDERVDAAWTDAVQRLDTMQARLAAMPPAVPAVFDPQATVVPAARTDEAAYLASVEAAKERIRAGDAFQVVLSQRFSVDAPASGLDAYRALRATNPSPYMILMRIPEDDGAPPDHRTGALSDRTAVEIVASSPEALVTVTGGRCVVHPIAGTRPRGATPSEDARLEEELRADEKEGAEHLMLVDLARNDLGRVCSPGSIRVTGFRETERYSHVMHLVSTVTGDLAPGMTAVDALVATFPAGTLSGAPKASAMAIIDELEPVRRGIYGGAIGYLDAAGDLDMAIAIRAAVIVDGVAHVQAGAGIVAGSDPDAEHAECRNKAAAVLRALAIAGTLAPAGEPQR